MSVAAPDGRPGSLKWSLVRVESTSIARLGPSD